MEKKVLGRFPPGCKHRGPGEIISSRFARQGAGCATFPVSLNRVAPSLPPARQSLKWSVPYRARDVTLTGPSPASPSRHRKESLRSCITKCAFCPLECLTRGALFWYRGSEEEMRQFSHFGNGERSPYLDLLHFSNTGLVKLMWMFDNGCG